MEIITLSGIAILATVISVMLKKYNPEYSMVLSLCTGIIILFLVISKVETITVKLNSLISMANIDSSYISILFKSVGICFMTQFASDSCSDAGENALASKIEFAGKILIIVTALPLFEQVANTALKLIR